MNNQIKKDAIANHRANMASSLKRRLEAARASNNATLIEALQQEMHQLGLN
ncbi:MAG: hypothetical protein SFT94_08010 [Pseudanabaenaceae cyanobacterium bins.68]|nr:hypothetical protein [Pseudanabaenaceae cyanobacterium bins.68]